MNKLIMTENLTTIKTKIIHLGNYSNVEILTKITNLIFLEE